MGNRKGKNRGKGRGKKRKQSVNEIKAAKKVENKREVEVHGEHHCLHKRPTHVWTRRCTRLGHEVECPIHPNSFSRRSSECVKCNSADRRQVQQVRDKKK
ncbi:hypothetical protein N7491_010632 [Penicillium cf. griseofulvum]|uniref:Uncharacterized protein n=1 Tax=Penicillium cf. griseofulvum TaxID=2972120 RepID=A0A9W9N053_9EURO|nr:hypothetical protein N7472_000960 [Penicillium cf. griseofulvum]KAJ5422187.1 hypothetical protein N7491_010632 [Penicillium cf. griseofulvum]KAJ5428372.1 hypothetical protein N7445_009826 [Penicillium cf. griseofulvum]